MAAWISAETGVGPSMASGSQVCSGICADLANAPTSSSTQAATSWASLLENASGVRRKTSGSRARPRLVKMRNVPITRPTSPTTLITNALMPAAVAVVRRYQKLISR